MSDKRIKLRDIEGDAGEITDLCKNLGFDLGSYLNEKPTKKDIPKIWIWIGVPFFFILCCIVWIFPLNAALYKISILALFIIWALIIVIIQFNYEKWILTLITGIAGMCLILISLEVYTPQEVVKKLEEQASEKMGEK